MICAQRAKTGVPCGRNEQCTFYNCKTRWCNAALGPDCASQCTGYDCDSLPVIWAKQENDKIKARKTACDNESHPFLYCDDEQLKAMYQLCDQLICKVRQCEGTPVAPDDTGISLCTDFWPAYDDDYFGNPSKTGNYASSRNTTKYPFHSGRRQSTCPTGGVRGIGICVEGDEQP